MGTAVIPLVSTDVLHALCFASPAWCSALGFLQNNKKWLVKCIYTDLWGSSAKMYISAHSSRSKWFCIIDIMIWGWVHTSCGRETQRGVWCVPVLSFSCESDPNFLPEFGPGIELKTHMIFSQCAPRPRWICVNWLLWKPVSLLPFVLDAGKTTCDSH